MKDAVGRVQSVLVLGGGSDIGLAAVRSLVRDGTTSVTLAARRPAELEGVAGELRDAGAKEVKLVRFDADDLDSHPAFVDEVFQDGDVDLVLVTFGVLQRTDLPDWRSAALALWHTNAIGTISVMLPVVERLEAQGHGTVVVLSSVAGERVRKANFVYGASKGAVDAFAQGLGDSLAERGVRVVLVRPGFVHTKMTAGLKAPPLSTTPEQVADAVVAALRGGRDIVWVPPALRWLMMVLRHLPRPLFRRLKV